MSKVFIRKFEILTIKVSKEDFYFVEMHSLHRHLSNIDCLMAHTACLVCFISPVNGCNKKKKKKPSLGRPALVLGTHNKP